MTKDTTEYSLGAKRPLGTPIPPLPTPLPMHYLPDHEPSTSTTPYPEPHPETLLDMQNREGEDYGRRQGYSTKMSDSFTPRFPNRPSLPPSSRSAPGGGVLLGPSLQSLGFLSEVSTLSARALLAQFPLYRVLSL